MIFISAGLIQTVHAQTTLNVAGPDQDGSGNWLWRPIMNTSGGYLTDTGPTPNGGTAGILDQQTGQPVADIVGYAANTPTAYIGYGTISSTQYIGFRVRLNQVAIQSGSINVSALKQVTYVGFDFDGNGSADMFVGADYKSSSFAVVIVDTANTATNLSPSTSDLLYSQSISPLYSYAVTSSNANYQQVDSTNTNEAGANLLISGDADAILTFAVPYADFIASVQNTNVMGSGFTFSSSTAYRITIATSNTTNTINQDAMSDLSVAFNFSTPTNSDGTPVPEPASAFILGMLLAPFAIRRPRRLAASTEDARN